MSASWFIMFIQPKTFEASAHWPLFVHSWRLWKLLSLFKCFRKKKSFFYGSSVIHYLLLAITSIWMSSAIIVHVISQQIYHAVRLWLRHLSFYVYLKKKKTFFICLCIIFFLSFKGVLLYILSGCSTACSQVVDECMCVWMWMCHHSICYRFLIFTMRLRLTRIDVSFYCDDLA